MVLGVFTINSSAYTEQVIIQQTSNGTTSGGNWAQQNFSLPGNIITDWDEYVITRIVLWANVATTIYICIYDSNGTSLGCSDTKIFQGITSFNFSLPYPTLTNNTTNYYFKTNGSINQMRVGAGSPYSGGVLYIDGVNYGTSAYMYIYGYPQNITLFSPANQSTLSKNYPPLTETIFFNWSNSAEDNYNLKISKDINFNLLAVDTVTTNNYSVQSLEAGNYWWKVKYYNATSGTYGNYSNVYNFTLTNTQTTSGTGIQGTVYELVDGVITPISNARVYIYNNLSTGSSEMTTGSNGYYLFTGLTNNTTYFLRATKSAQYTDSVPYYITTGSGTTSTQDILLEKCQSGDTCFYGQVTPRIYFIYQNATNTTFMSGYPVRIFVGNEVLPLYTLTTDSDGMVSPRLAVGTRYRFEIYAIGTSSPTLITNLLDSYKTATSDDIVFYIGSLNGTIPLPSAPDTNATNVTNRSTGGGLAQITNATLTSTTGIGVLGQGVLVSFITWIVAGAGGPLTVLFTCSILAYMGILTWTTMFLFVITSASIYILKEM